MKPHQKMEQARIEILLNPRLRYYAGLMLSVKIEADPSVETACCNGRIIKYNPEFIDDLSFKQTIGLLLHEIYHPLYGHHYRRGNRNFRLWNTACDYEINWLISKEKIELPNEGCIDEKFKNMAVEEIYEQLMRQVQQQLDQQLQPQPELEPQNQQNQNQQNQNQQNQNQQNQNQQNQNQEPQNQEPQNQEPQNQEPQNQEPQNQEPQNQEPQNQEPQNQNQQPKNIDQIITELFGEGDDPGGCGMVEDMPTENNIPTPSEISNEERKWQSSLIQMAMHSGGVGNIPGHLQRHVEEILNPKIDWRTELREFVNACASSDYSWSKPNRKYTQMDLYLPSIRSYELGKVMIVVDNSGSISQEDLDMMGAELTEILESFQNLEACVIYHDTTVRKQETYTIGDLPLKLRSHGGGGTRFRPVFEYINDLDEPPICLIWFTDLGYHDRNLPPEPEYPVLWGAIDAYNLDMPFGRVIIIRD